jgi:hypothetical protein
MLLLVEDAEVQTQGANSPSDIGVPAFSGQAAAIRQHVLELPAPVVADALSYHPVTTAGLAAQAGATFSRYAPCDHERSPAGRGES